MISQAEQTLASGAFGTVTDKRVIYQRAKGLFSGGSREDIPLKHVTSVRLDTTRHIFGGIVLVILGFSFVFSPSVNANVTGSILLCLAVLLLWGSPTVIVNTAGQDKNAARGWPWERAAATAFVEAVRTQLVQQ